MIRYLLAAIALFATPTMAANCPTGQQKSHGKCVSKPTAEQTAPLLPVLNKPATLTSTRFLGANTVFSNFSVTGLGAITRPASTAANVIIRDVQTDGAENLVRTYSGGINMPNTLIERIVMNNNGAGGFIFRAGSWGTIRDVTINATRPNTDCSKVPEGIALAGKGATDNGGPWTMDRIYIRGIRSTGCSFANGDAIAVERGYHDGLIANAYGGFNSDAGFDIKSPTFRLDNVISENNRRSYKFWANQSHGTLTSINPGQSGNGAPAHIQLHGTTTETRTMRIAKLIAYSDNTTPIFEVEDGPWDVTIDTCDLRVPVGTKMLVGKATLHLGPGCIL